MSQLDELAQRTFPESEERAARCLEALRAVQQETREECAKITENSDPAECLGEAESMTGRAYTVMQLVLRRKAALIRGLADRLKGE
jgi:DNA-binding transcriptional regulator YbjK